MKFIFLVFANLRRKKLRTILTVLSVFVAFLLFGLLCALKEGLTAGVSIADADRLVVRNKITLVQPLPQSYIARITSTPGVEAVAAQSWFGGIYQDPKNFFATIAVDPAAFMEVFSEITLSEEEKNQWLATRNGAIAGLDLMKRFGWKIGDTIPLTSPIWGQPDGEPAWKFQIVGDYDTTKKGGDKSSFYFRFDYFDEGRVELKGLIGWLTLRVEDQKRAPAIAQAIDAQFANSPYETTTEGEGAFAAGFAQQVGDVGAIVAGVLGAVIFTILLVSGNTMSQAVRERTEEIGVLKAMGYPDGLVLVLVLLESSAITLVGGVAGLAVARLIAVANPFATVLPSLVLPDRDLLIGAGSALALGLAAGLLPAVQAMRLRISTALRRT